MFLDDDQAALVLMALRHVEYAARSQSLSSRTDSGCDGAVKSCIDGYCLPKFCELTTVIEQHQKDEADGD